MKLLFPAVAIVAGGLIGAVSIDAQAVARFENGTTVDRTTGYLKNEFLGAGDKNVEVRLLNANLRPINIVIGENNDIDGNGTAISGGSAILNYFAQYFATGKVEAGPVTTSV
jgi:major type 1 subunit fimbrin (pilin)